MARRFGAAKQPGGGTVFRLWAPDQSRVDLVLRDAPAGSPSVTVPMSRVEDDFFYCIHPDAEPGWRYAFLVDGEGPYPDPASRSQPDGVHGWSELVDDPPVGSISPSPVIDPAQAVVYELHVGTFTPEGTYAAAIEKIPYLCELGVNVLELMPLAEFPGQRNWGYDGVYLFAPTRAYGPAHELRAFINACHAAGLAVLLDVVYNHVGPDGNYLWVISRRFFSPALPTPWGDGVDIAQPVVAAFFEENIRYWIRDFGFDGFRFDAVHALDPDHRTGFLERLAHAARDEAAPGRHPLLLLENRDNQAHLLGNAPDEYDAQCNDDYRYALHARFLDEHTGVYADFLPAERHFARVLREGFAFQGEWAAYYRRNRGSASAGLPASCFVQFVESHDVPGNRPLGERFHHLLPPDLSLAISLFTLLLPSIPMLFMGEEFRSSSPFLYFTDHHQELGEQVRLGRLAMLKRRIAAEQLAMAPEHVPNPQDAATFKASQLKWEEADPHQPALALYRAALTIRRRYYGDLRRGPNDRQVMEHKGIWIIVMRSSDAKWLLAFNSTPQYEALPLALQSAAWQAVFATSPATTTTQLPPASTTLWTQPISET